jgi:hypothetical protein
MLNRIIEPKHDAYRKQVRSKQLDLVQAYPKLIRIIRMSKHALRMGAIWKQVDVT